MPRIRPLPLLFAAGYVAAVFAAAQPAAAQEDFFDWLNGAPPKKKQEETYKGEVPEPVQRDTLPDLAPAPAEGRDAPVGPNQAGEPIPRGPNGEAFDDGTRPADAAATNSGQFDPLESRRSRSQGATPAKPQWQNPDNAARRDSRSGYRDNDPAPAEPARNQRYAPGSFEDEQSPGAEPRQDRDQDDEAAPPPDRRQGMTAPPADQQYDGAPIDRRRQGMNAPASADRYQDDRDARPPQRGYDDRQGDRQQPSPSYSPQGNAPGHVERDNLQGPRSADGAPSDPWTGMPVAELEETLSRIELPPRSPAIHELWLRLITARSSSPDPKLAAIRADALNRTGMIREAAQALAQAGDVSADPVIATLAARTAIGAGNTEQGCETARSLTSAVAAKMPQHLKGEVILIAGFCAAASENKAAAGIAGDLAIENGLKDHAGPEALKAIAAGHKPAVAQGMKVSLLDYRILQLAGPVDLSYAIPTASPSLLAVLARDNRADPGTRLAAAEAAASLNAITIDELAAAYRASAGEGGGGNVELSDAGDTAGQPARRARMFASAESERSPVQKARVIRAFLDEARRAGFYWQALQLMTRPVADLPPNPQLGWFAETAIEASLAGGDFNGVHRWANFAASPESRSRADLRHWLALADIAEPDARDRTQHLVAIEEAAQSGRFDPALLHRLATALDALDTNVPIPLWEAASRTAQPSTGHLPDTGVLSQLQDAAKTRDFTRTVLLTMRTIGPNGAEGAHMIALGDAIRALKRAGLETEARRLALEALFPAWPRANNS